MNSECTASSASAVTRTSTSSPGLERGVTPRDDQAVGPDHRHHDRIAGEVEVGDGDVVGGRVLGQGDLDQMGRATLELQEPDERADRDRLLHQRGEQLGGRHRDVHPPALVEEPLVLRVVDPGHDPGDGELLLGQQRNHEVVLVVAGGGDDDVDGGQAGRVERRDLARVAATQVTASVGRSRSTSSGSRSKTSTSWPLACRSDAMAVPTLPAPAMATFTSGPGRACRCGRKTPVQLAQRVVEHHEVQDVALLAHQLAGIEPRDAGAGHRRRG